MWVWVEATLVADHQATLCADIEARLVVSGACQVGGLADGAQLAAGHGRNLRHRVGGGGDTTSVRGHRGGPAGLAATHVHLQALPGNVTLTLLSLGRWWLRAIMGR